MNINLVAMDGGHKSVPVGLASYRSVKHHHNVETMLHSKSYMDPRPGRSAIHDSCKRMGDLLKSNGLKVFTIETTVNNNTFPDPFGFMNKREWEWSLLEQGTYLAAKKANDMGPSAIEAPDLDAHQGAVRRDRDQRRRDRGRARADARHAPPAAAGRGRTGSRTSWSWASRT